MDKGGPFCVYIYIYIYGFGRVAESEVRRPSERLRGLMDQMGLAKLWVVLVPANGAGRLAIVPAASWLTYQYINTHVLGRVGRPAAYCSSRQLVAS